MFQVRSIAFVVLALAVFTSARAQESRDSDQKREAAIRKIQRLLDEPLIQRKDFAQEMPLAKFLDAEAKRLPKDKQMTLRIDRDALGDKYAEVAATPVILLKTPKGASLRTVLDRVIAQAKTKIDYRVEPTGIVLTTPKQAVFTATYDIRSLVEQPDRVGLSGAAFRKADAAQKAARVVPELVAMTSDAEKPALAKHESIEIVNGVRLVVRAGGSRQAELARLISLFTRISDLSVIMRARLIEIDEAPYKRITNAKRLSMQDVEKLERQFLESPPAKKPPIADWEKTLKELAVGEEIKVNNGQSAGLLSKHRVIACGPGPEQLRKGDKGPQMVFEGVAFLAEPQVSPDRRWINMKITEKAAELELIEKVKVWLETEKQGDADVAHFAETTHTLSRIIPDGGTIIIPVYYRPRSAKEKNRYLALVITARIRMEEEERRIRESEIQEILPLIVADVLRNPALKATRDFYGSPGDKRFALVDSDAWTWPKAPPLAIAGYSLTPAKREGKRLLGIRVEKADEGKITVALFNAGGITNGTAIGAVLLRYVVRPGNGAWTVGLADR